MTRRYMISGMLLALMVLLQSLRLVMPLPPFISMFGVGSAINACLLLSMEYTAVSHMVALAVLMPLVAYLQGALLFPVIIPVIAGVNILYGLSYAVHPTASRGLTAAKVGLVRFLASLGGAALLLALVEMPAKAAGILRFVLSWPQLVTGVLGAVLALLVMDRLGRRR